MMKKLIFLLVSALFALQTNAISVQRVEPLCWWTDMNCPLQLMLYGEHIADAQVTIEGGDGLVLSQVHKADSRNYLFLDLDVRRSGEYAICLKQGKKKTRVAYHIYERASHPRESFSSKDVIYLLMPDRFCDGNPANNNCKGMTEPCRPDYIHGRYGGDIQGIMNQLDHICETGATAIWATPLTWSNDSAFSYHGYACADYYHIDPRFGTNELYLELCRQAHEHGLKMIWDVVTNHCGITHWWSHDLPFRDWYHLSYQVDDQQQMTLTNNVFSAAYDPNASRYDWDNNVNGWFDRNMPDMNLSNPYVLHYLTQVYIWWIEFAQLDGLRIDTYPYNDKEPMSRFCKALRTEYPWLNIVGECWTRPASAVAYWQADARNADGYNSNLPCVMDFPLEEAIRQALSGDGKGWGEGTMRIYDALAQDGLYADPYNLLVFVSNHDMDRIVDVVRDHDYRRVMLAHVLVATMRGIPQLFAGDEYAQASKDVKMGHSGLRQLLPTKEKLSSEQLDYYHQFSRLFQWRRNEPTIWYGKTKHFMARDNTYAFFRYTQDEAVFVYINASEEERVIPTRHYDEVLKHYRMEGINPLTGETIDFNREDIAVPKLSYLVVKLVK